jgi:hypothetical protein
VADYSWKFFILLCARNKQGIFHIFIDLSSFFPLQLVFFHYFFCIFTYLSVRNNDIFFINFILSVKQLLTLFLGLHNAFLLSSWLDNDVILDSVQTVLCVFGLFVHDFLKGSAFHILAIHYKVQVSMTFFSFFLSLELFIYDIFIIFRYTLLAIFLSWNIKRLVDYVELFLCVRMLFVKLFVFISSFLIVSL